MNMEETTQNEIEASSAEESVQEAGTEGTKEIVEQPASSPAPKKVNKHHLAKSKLAEAETRIKSTDEEIEACLAKIDEDMQRFKGVESRFFDQTLKPAQTMLKNLGATDRVLESTPAPKVDLNDPDIEAVEIKPISSGAFKGLMLGLTSGIVALGGWCYMATQALGLPLIPQKLPDMERWTRVLEWTSQKIGQGANVAVGLTALVLAVLVIVWFVYWLTKTLTAGSNLKKAVRIEEDTEFYCTKKGECKAQMENVREHIAHAQKTVEKYDVLLAEQNARLRRALYIEEAEKYDQLHAKTQQDVKTIKHLTTQIERFLETPMAEHGILSQEGIATLEEVNKVANDYVMELYG
jgi:predicted transposase YbfD/YdcC